MHTNRLANEKSPYLQQHAHNPVDWYPWGEEAFERARREDKPIFLSIGYSTCHWCHVMERESFESESLAEVLNRFFIPIKVDREERPDVDRVYMTFVQATTGGGGWPMSVWLTPELKPFLGGTYFPPDDRYGRPGFRSVLEQIAKAWESDQTRILQSSHDVLAELEKHVQVKGDAAYLDDRILESGFNVFRRTYDVRLGGFGNAPKFPRPAVFNFLLRYYRRTGNQEALHMTVNTLKAMARGGMYDHLGGGFHRYSVDARWFVPHFEKMLYDQAQLAIAYLEAFQITGEAWLQETARGILDYVLRDMRSPEGGFYSAEDADSVIDPAQPHEKGEGAFYIWSAGEIRSLVDSPVLDWFQYRYGVEAAGNVQEDPQGEFTGRNILYEAHTVEETAERFDLPEAEIRRGLEEATQKLLAHRSGRIRPHLDDKILTCWNGLMISAFAKAGQVLGESKYSEAASTAADFILSKLYERYSGRLLRRFREGEAAIPGFLDDYAFLAQGLLDLYETTFDIHHLDTAIRLTETM
ncbi:MAG TPA: thioredoxin domain-containing protein, partial [Bryobacteraceae bacterium]|nr:thioredoxin domain-containing protein [Bryobacteraceae bacterium]